MRTHTQRIGCMARQPTEGPFAVVVALRGQERNLGERLISKQSADSKNKSADCKAADHPTLCQEAVLPKPAFATVRVCMGMLCLEVGWILLVTVEPYVRPS